MKDISSELGLALDGLYGIIISIVIKKTKKRGVKKISEMKRKFQSSMLIYLTYLSLFYQTIELGSNFVQYALHGTS